MLVRRLRCVLRRALPALVAPVLVVPALAATHAQAQSAAPLRAAQLAAASPLTQAQAQAQAESSGQAVTVSALTTPASITTANPDGSFTTDESAEPVRAWRDGGWASLDPTLHANSDGTISPAVTTSRLTLSGGGHSPMAVMRAAGRTLSLSWPQALPAPTLSGATATYADVLPGVDLVVAADDQGGFSEVLVVKDASAAQNPALASLTLGASAPGLTLSADAAGDLSASAAPSAPPVFTAPAPLMWDSAPPPVSQAVVAGPGGTSLTAPSGAPADSSAAAPGVAAHVTTVPETSSPGSITLAPPASALTGSGVTYPIYIDPTWHPVNLNSSAWTQVDKGYPGTSYWKESSQLQAGYCDFADCKDVNVARSFIRLPIPSQLTPTTVVNNADLYMDDVWSADGCTATTAQLWTTGGISSSTTWNNQPSWENEMEGLNFAFGSSGCGSFKNDVTWHSSALTSIMQRDATQSWSSQTFGIRAGDESNDLQWKKFHNGSNGYIHMSVTYNDPPNRPTARSSSPGGSCKYSASDAPTIGNDEVALSATASDDDGDNSLATKFYLKDSTGTTVFTTTDTVGNNDVAHALVTRDDFQSFNGDGQEHTYHWYAVSTDDAGLSSTNPSDDCYFKYNPAAPGEPAVTLSAGSAPIGQQITATISPPAGTCPGNACPVSYTYQLGSTPPVTVQIASDTHCDSTTISCTLPITIPRVGAMILTITGVAAGGNPGEPATPSIDGLKPATPYADGDVNGDGQPDLLTLGKGSKPSLWLSPGTGPGSIDNAIDIGGAGTGISPGADGPADWAGAAVLHGDFTGNHVQDVMAYYPSTGTGKIIGGNGVSSPLVPTSGNVATVDAGLMPGANGDDPEQLVAAGNASEIGTGTDDLIGISGDSTNPDDYELDLYTNGQCPGCATPSPIYGWTAVLSSTAPAGSWHDYTLASVHLPDASYPGGDPANTALFALDTSTGALYESTNPGQASCSDFTQPGCTIIGMPDSTWTQITVPWGATPPSQLTGDINAAGKTELWAGSSNGTTATAYTLTGTTLSTEATDSVAQPHNDWPLAEGSGCIAADTIAGKDAAFSGDCANGNSGATWTDDTDSRFDNFVTLDGTTGYLSPPAGTIPSAATTPKISVYFRTTTADGVLVGISGSALSPGGTASSYDPVLYVGTDGRLYGEWWNGQSPASPAVSATVVDDGLWHHAVLTGYADHQTLYLDNQPGVTISGSIDISGQGSHLYFGAGYTGGNWPAEPHFKQTNAPDYFNGDIAAIIYSYPGGP